MDLAVLHWSISNKILALVDWFFDDVGYHLLLESDTDRSAGEEIFIVTFSFIRKSSHQQCQSKIAFWR